MASTYYQQHKHAIYTYRINHHEKFNEYQRTLQRKYDSWKRISKIFREILI